MENSGEVYMKIAIFNDSIYPYSKGGSEKRDWEIAKRLASKGHDVNIFGVKEWFGQKTINNEGVFIHGIDVKVRRHTKNGRRSIAQMVIFSIMAPISILHSKFDVIVVCNSPYFLSFTMGLVSRIQGTPFFANWDEIWGDYWYEYMSKIGATIGKEIEKLAVKFPDGIIAVSEDTRKKLIATGVNPKMISVIKNGIDFKEISSIIPYSSICFKKADVLFVGRLIKDKNADVLIKAIALAKTSHPGILCSIIGDGPEKEILTKLTKGLKLEKNIEFIGFLEKYSDVIAHMKNSKIFAFPSTREGFGIVIIEANACGLPVICVESKYSRCVNELVEDGYNGFLLNNLDENILAKKIEMLMDNEDLRLKMSENGIRIAKEYDWTIIANQFEKLCINSDNLNSSPSPVH